MDASKYKPRPLTSVRMLTWVLIALGAIMTATIVAPIVYIESGDLVPIDSSYFWMMIVPAIVAVAILLYQRQRGIDRPSSLAAICVGIVIATYPFWGPSLDAGMYMPLDWIGTILGHYVPGTLVVLAGFLQLFDATMSVPSRRGAS
jgi:hypothetical protein